jgi:hypothetical protein
MPVITTGDQKKEFYVVFKILIEACIHWLQKGGLPLDLIKIVLLEGSEFNNNAVIEFSKLKNDFYSVNNDNCKDESDLIKYDVFISYSHKNTYEAYALVDKIKSVRPNIRIFIDKLELNTGVAWQQNLFEALESSKTVICLYSPDYLQSKVCKDEFHAAWIMHRENEKSNILFPILLYSVELPIHMQLIQFEDVREGNLDRMYLTVNNFLNAHFPH